MASLAVEFIQSALPASVRADSPVSHDATWHEERREVFDSVLRTLDRAEPDSGRLAACAYLLRHLARTAVR